MDNEIIYKPVQEFLSGLIKNDDPLLKDMEAYARKNHIPIIQRESARFLEIMCTLAKPQRILEVGTGIGYSAIILARIMKGCGIIDSIELDPDMAAEANRYIKESGCDKIIRVINGDAKEVLQCLTKPYDFIFLDAAKGQYNDFLPYCLDLLNAGGLLVADNVLYRGLVARGFVEHKHRTIAVRLKEFIHALIDNKQLKTSIIPIGDGIAISIREEDGNVR